MVEATGMQQVLSLSTMAEKMQQTHQQRPDLAQATAAMAPREDEKIKASDLSPTQKPEETNIKEEYTDRKGMQYRKGSGGEKEKKEEKRERKEEKSLFADSGKLVDIVV